MIDAPLIVSLQNSHVKQAVRLRNRRERDETKLYLIEGYRELLRALEQKAKIDRIYFCPEFFLGSSETNLLDRASEAAIKLIQLSKVAFAKISYRDRPDGLLGIGEQEFRTVQDCESFLLQRINPILLIVETLEKPGNLGSIIRSADGAGADAILVCDPATDIHNPNVIRASVGTFFSMPLFVMSSQEALRILQKHKIPVYATSPDATTLYHQIDCRNAVAFAMGKEQVGLSKFWLEGADASIVIPMLGIADSLNVSNAATILLYETLRQRSL